MNKTLLTSAALFALLAAPSVAQETEGRQSGVSPSEYFGQRTQAAAEREDDAAPSQDGSPTAAQRRGEEQPSDPEGSSPFYDPAPQNDEADASPSETDADALNREQADRTTPRPAPTAADRILQSRSRPDDASSPEAAAPEDDERAAAPAPAPAPAAPTRSEPGAEAANDDAAPAAAQRPQAGLGGALVYRRVATLAPGATKATDFLGQELTNDDGDAIAKIDDVIVDDQGFARGVILSTGGLFGFGADTYAVDFDRVRVVREDGEARARSALSEQDVERLRPFDLDAFRSDPKGMRLASSLAGASVALGDSGESGEVADVVMAPGGQVASIVMRYRDAQYAVPFGRIEQDTDGLSVAIGPDEIGTLDVFDAGVAARRGGLRRMMGGDG